MDNYGWIYNTDEDYLKYLVARQPIVAAVGADADLADYAFVSSHLT